MSIECYLDNCPHHDFQHLPADKLTGPYCSLERCAWDEPTMSRYLEAVRTKKPDPESVLPEDLIITCDNSEEPTI